jgi:hypothetical protein
MSRQVKRLPSSVPVPPPLMSVEILAVSRFQSTKCGAVAGRPSFFTSRVQDIDLREIVDPAPGLLRGRFPGIDPGNAAL